MPVTSSVKVESNGKMIERTLLWGAIVTRVFIFSALVAGGFAGYHKVLRPPIADVDMLKKQVIHAEAVAVQNCTALKFQSLSDPALFALDPNGKAVAGFRITATKASTYFFDSMQYTLRGEAALDMTGRNRLREAIQATYEKRKPLVCPHS